MSSIDQAFIKAYRTEQEPPAHVSRGSVTHRQERRVPGPHADFSARPKRPLSEAIAARSEPALPARRSPAGAGTTVEKFAWPEIAAQLASQCSDAYRRMLTYATRAGGVVGFLGVAEGVGCTTTVLGAALAAGRSGARVAMIDADPTTGALARSLGFLHARSLADAIAASAPPSEAVIHSAVDNVSLALALSDGDGANAPSLREALAGLTSGHSALLIDLGSYTHDSHDQPWRDGGALGLDAVILVRRAGADEAELNQARRALTDAGHAVIGVVDSFALA